MAINSPAKKGLRRLGRFIIGLFIFFNVVMAFNAWKFTHFYDDPSLRGPQPTGVWATTKNILFGQSAPKRLNDSTPSVPFQKVYLTTKDGIKLEGWEMTHNNTNDTSLSKLEAPKTIVMFHGHGSCKSSVLNEAYAFLNMGYHVFMIDFRAHGGSTGEQCTVGINEDEDVRMAYEYVKNKTKLEPIMWGVSLGAATITRAVSQYNLHPQKLILEMPFGSLNQAVKGFLRIKKLPQPLAPFLTFWGGTLNGVWTFGHRPTEFAKQITCPTLLQWGINDPRVSRGEIDEIFENINTTKKKLVLYETAAHESLCKKENQKWTENVKTFLSAN